MPSPPCDGNYKMNATDQAQRLPEEREILIATVRQLSGHGVYVMLDEYNNITDFLHISEIATGWIRNIERHVRPKQKVVLKVIRVNKLRAEGDTSVKQGSGEERKSKLIEVKKNDMATTFLDFIKSKLKLSDQQVQEIEIGYFTNMMIFMMLLKLYQRRVRTPSKISNCHPR